MTHEGPERLYHVFYAPSNTVLVIQDVAPEEALLVPLGSDHKVRVLSKSKAWSFARSQVLPVVFMARDRRQQSVGRIFDPRQFERQAFEDARAGFERPKEFDEWVREFRKDPVSYFEGFKNLSAVQVGSLATYRQLLAATTPGSATR